MIVILGGLNILEKVHLVYLESCLQSWKEQTSPVKLRLSIYVKDKWLDSLQKILEKYQDVRWSVSHRYQDTIEHLDALLSEEDWEKEDWVGFTELGVWDKYRLESFGRCLKGISQFSNDQQEQIQYIRMARSVFTDASTKGLITNSTINKWLEEGKIIDNEDNHWGQLIEYYMKPIMLKKGIDRLKSINLDRQGNSERYLLKWLHIQNFKFLQLNMKQVPISFWLYFYPENTPNGYFRKIRVVGHFESILEKVKQQPFFPQHQRFNYLVDDIVSTSLGPGKIQSITTADTTIYQVELNWDDTDKGRVEYFHLSDLMKIDTDKIRGSLYRYTMELLNNIELYLLYFIFDAENPPGFNHFYETTKQIIQEHEEKNKKDNVMDKLFAILDFKQNMPRETIYQTDLAKDIFQYVIELPVYQRILKL